MRCREVLTTAMAAAALAGCVPGAYCDAGDLKEIKRVAAEFRQELLRHYRVNAAKIEKPKYSVAQIVEQVDKVVYASVHAKYTDEMRERIMAEAQAGYPLYEVGREVTVKKGYQRFNGTVREITPMHMKVGDVRVPRRDLDEDGFDHAKRQRQWADHVRRHYHEPRRAAMGRFKATREKRLAATMRAQGYVKVGDDWLTKGEALKRVDEEVREFHAAVAAVVAKKSK